MSTPGLEEFEKILKEIPTLPPPGVSGSRIKKLTDIAVKEISPETESKLMGILYSQCKANPSTNKLSTLYIVDSIVRKFIEEANKKGEALVPDAPEGTYASAVFKTNELIESIVDDAMEFLINPSVNNKIEKLIEIWAKLETFSPDIIRNLKKKYFSSTTPPGSPPRTSIEPVKPNDAEHAQESNSILLALASLTKGEGANESERNSQPSTTNLNDGSSTSDILSQLSSTLAANGSSNNTSISQPPQAATVPPPQQQQQYPPYQQPGLNNDQQVLFNMLQQMLNNNAAEQPPVPQGPAGYDGGRRPRDNDYGSYGRRNRSRSPGRGGNKYVRSPPNASVQALQQNMQNLRQHQHGNHHKQGGHGGNPAFVLPNAMGGEVNEPGNPHYRPRNVGFDATIPQATVKVLSRTLFIGGVPRNMDERALAQVLRPFGEIQSVILNSEKKHAFVKVYSRREAEQVITSFNKDGALPLRTRWGVGFGPRDCCNYQHGISIIPIQRLTDADRNWIVNAQWGGTGGQPILSGMVVDEPDIEIGSGLSSKAMSRKMPTNSARNGPRSNRPGEPDEEYVKTTLIPQQNIQMSHGAQPEFNTYQLSAVNPLQGLFGNGIPQQAPMASPQQQQQQQQPQANDALAALAAFMRNAPPQ
ncbi:Protein NRD1 [Candida viswanathii]|uniref:Protein NRD1 n=1 Tax=Candida viswanathii TaxID=5486 RepID=A0A367YH74_9ASCO|nr:Protein NRD1 [Candida viswanathii]